MLKIIDLFIQMEEKATELYLFFSRIFSEDVVFWSSLAEEEKEHAYTLMTAKDLMLSTGVFSTDIIPDSADIEETIDQINEVLTEYKNNPELSRQSAFANALKIERSAGEKYFNTIIKKETGSEPMKILKQLNEDEYYHVRKIKDYADSILTYRNFKNC